jgi:subtilisin family serine protease
MSFTGISLTQDEKQMIAANKDILFVVAAGNGQQGKDRNHTYPSELDLPNILSVAALNKDEDDKAEFSASGPNVDVLAPGEDVRVKNPSLKIEEVSGTSFAAPYVSNIAAKVLLINPDLSVEELKKLLLETYKITKENREYLIKIDRRQRYNFYWRIFVTILAVSSALGIYYYFQPYLDQVLDIYNQVEKSVNQFGTIPDQIKNLINK